MRLPKTLLISLIFACIGITTEVVFTSISKIFINILEDGVVDWALGGKTYLWMFFIYATIPFLMKIFEPLVKNYHFLIKALLGVFIIYIVEFTTGLGLELATGLCPWKYTEGLHILGFIRLDYFPAWYLFSVIIISVYQTLDTRLLD